MAFLSPPPSPLPPSLYLLSCSCADETSYRIPSGQDLQMASGRTKSLSLMTFEEVKSTNHHVKGWGRGSRNQHSPCDPNPSLHQQRCLRTSLPICEDCTPNPRALWSSGSGDNLRGSRNQGGSRDCQLQENVKVHDAGTTTPPWQQLRWRHCKPGLPGNSSTCEWSAPGSGEACTPGTLVATEKAVHTTRSLSYSHIQGHRQAGSSLSEASSYGSSGPQFPPCPSSSPAAFVGLL